MDRFHPSARGDWFFTFLERNASPHLISAIEKDSFIAEAWNVVGRKVAKERLLIDIYETAKTFASLPVGPDSDAVDIFRLVLGEGRGLIAQRNQIERRALELLKDLPVDICPRDRPNQSLDHSCQSRGLAPFQSSPPVFEVLRHRPCDH